jgi:phosphate sodium symporter
LLLQHCQLTEVHLIKASREIFEGVAQGLMNDNIRYLRSSESLLKDVREMWKRYRRKEIIGMRKIDRLQAIEKDTWFYLGINSISQILYGLKRMLEPILEHVDNNFNPLPDDYVQEYAPIVERTSKFLTAIQTSIDQNDFSNSDEVLVEGSMLKNEVSAVRHSLQERIQRDESNLNVALLYLSTLQETQEIISNARHLLRAAKRFSS